MRNFIAWCRGVPDEHVRAKERESSSSKTTQWIRVRIRTTQKWPELHLLNIIYLGLCFHEACKCELVTGRSSTVSSAVSKNMHSMSSRTRGGILCSRATQFFTSVEDVYRFLSLKILIHRLKATYFQELIWLRSHSLLRSYDRLYSPKLTLWSAPCFTVQRTTHLVHRIKLTLQAQRDNVQSTRGVILLSMLGETTHEVHKRRKTEKANTF